MQRACGIGMFVTLLEINVECPESMKEEVSDILVKCMVAGGKPFCPNVFLGADVSIGDHWIH